MLIKSVKQARKMFSLYFESVLASSPHHTHAHRPTQLYTWTRLKHFGCIRSFSQLTHILRHMQSATRLHIYTLAFYMHTHTFIHWMHQAHIHTTTRSLIHSYKWSSSFTASNAITYSITHTLSHLDRDHRFSFWFPSRNQHFIKVHWKKYIRKQIAVAAWNVAMRCMSS